jgi:hypothetical protein
LDEHGWFCPGEGTQISVPFFLHGTNQYYSSSNKVKEFSVDTMNDAKTYEEATRITIIKFIFEGRTNRVLIKSRDGNYFLDFSIHSNLERSFTSALISAVKALSFIIPTLTVEVNKIIN